MLRNELIPDFITDNACLYNVLMLQMERLLVSNLSVPLAVQGLNFTYTLNCKEMKVHALCRALQKAKNELEKYSGVNLDYYYRLDMTKKKRKRVAEKGDVGCPKKKLGGLWGSLHTHPVKPVAKGDISKLVKDDF